jgi:arylamine N-acetyltransferase
VAADLLMANWFMNTHPDARFMTSFFVSRVIGNTRQHIVNGAHVIRRADGTAVTTKVVDKRHLMQLLDNVFGLHPTDTDGIDRYLHL